MYVVDIQWKNIVKVLLWEVALSGAMLATLVGYIFCVLLFFLFLHMYHGVSPG